MSKLTKQYYFLLLSWVTIIFCIPAQADYTNPFVPVYVKGDDMSRAPIKPAVIYNEVPGSQVIISNMPAYKTQDELGECRAFSLATLVQKYTCDTWKTEIPDCKNLPEKRAISYFGMLAYTNRSIEESGTLQPNQTIAKGMYEIINDLANSGNQLILESCKPFDTLVNSFSTTGQLGLDKYNKFIDHLKKMYNSKKSMTEANIADCPECLVEINQNAGLNTDLLNLKKALTKDSFDKFLYTLFFDGCKLKNFPAGFRPQAYPVDSIDATPADIKNKALEGLRKGKPVMFPSLCVSRNVGSECNGVHSLVVSGYKKVCEPNRKTACKELFKVHNSWGAEWQKIYNDGWVDADAFTSNMSRVGPSNRIDSSSVMWLEP